MSSIKRLCIYPKDIMRITGRSERSSRLLFKKIKIHLDKKDHQVLTIKEFSEYAGIEEDMVNKYI
ncbi:hypothetical protein ES677_14430 [Bizionia gelidisalsuginis]|uniref:Uncharacterized protein n=2 Tax=Bizionia TaxID=283785 RepID=A0A8H2LDE6_9FLAO|nr:MULTISPECIES: hypothetical protein [Bizionia]TYB73006.1 hypothetical protein ES676_09615 [Bizionia saleffrena]TYC08425.1 hypothetical protein ES677_14430 [Bizionia gelidisalsuginis]